MAAGDCDVCPNSPKTWFRQRPSMKKPRKVDCCHLYVAKRDAALWLIAPMRTTFSFHLHAAQIYSISPRAKRGGHLPAHFSARGEGPSLVAGLWREKNRNVVPLKQRKAALEKILQRRSHSTAIVFTWLQCEHCIGVEGHRRQNRTSSGTTHAGLVVAVPLGMCCSGRLERRLAKAESSYYLATSYCTGRISLRQTGTDRKEDRREEEPWYSENRVLEHHRTLTLPHTASWHS